MIYKNEEVTKLKIKSKYHYLKVGIAIVLLIVVVLAIYTAFLISLSLDSDEKEYIYGMKAYMIDTTSMEPDIEIGDVIIVKKVESIEKLDVGDVITFKNRGEIITHRISAINTTSNKISTKGDKNENEDIESIKIEDVYGKVKYKIPKFKLIEKIFSSLLYWMIIIIIIATLYMHSRRINRRKKMRRRKKKIEDKKNENIESVN